jgi:hypothetical protein
MKFLGVDYFGKWGRRKTSVSLEEFCLRARCQIVVATWTKRGFGGLSPFPFSAAIVRSPTPGSLVRKEPTVQRLPIRIWKVCPFLDDLIEKMQTRGLADEGFSAVDPLPA